MISFVSGPSASGLAKLALLTALTFLPSTFAAVVPRQDSFRVMIVGDSITQGREGDYTWRYRIWQWFEENYIPVTFVGPYSGTVPPADPAPPGPPPLFGETTASAPLGTNGLYAPDVDSAFLSNDLHFGMWGRQLAQDKDLIADMISQYTPEYLLVELGFNDMGWFVSDAQGTMVSMEEFIDNARSVKGDIKFAIANVPQRTYIGGRDDLITKTDTYNELLAAAIPSWTTAESPIYLVDFRDNYSCEPQGGCPAGTDGLHPNILGEYQIAKAFVDVLHYGYGLGSGPLSIPGSLPT